MALLITDCPHCQTKRSAMEVFGAKTWPRELMIAAGKDGSGLSAQRWDTSIAAQCQSCHKPVAALVISGQRMHANQYETFAAQVNKQLLGPGNVTDLDFKVQALWPEAPAPAIPAHLPPSVERALLQAEKNFPVVGNEEAAAMMYRRALELTLGHLFADLRGTLAVRIKRLVKDKVLPEAIGDWADEIRDLGNEAAHDAEEVPRAELKMIRGFTDATLRYLYTLPAEVAARRKLPSDADDTVEA